jgi:hypothetical protein
MNADTGRVYWTEEDVEAAIQRKEALIHLSADDTLGEVAEILNRRQRRAARYGDKSRRTYGRGFAG